MSQAYQTFTSIAPSRTNNAYIFQLVQTVGNGLAAITSADELVVVDRQNLSANQTIFFDGTPTGTNCLVTGDASGQSLICSGTDGHVVIYDVRSQKRSSQFKIGMICPNCVGTGLRLTGNRSSRHCAGLPGLQGGCWHRVQESASHRQRLVPTLTKQHGSDS